MNAAEHIVEVNESNAQQLLIDESFNRPVVVDFWADWCEPCKTLMPLLEKLAVEYDGAFLLAKVNADEQQGLAGQLGVRSLPTVMVIKEGQPIDGFAGAQPETQIREMLQKHLPSPYEAKLEEANRLAESGDIAGALGIVRPLWESAGKPQDVTYALAAILIQGNRCDDAEEVLSVVRMADQDAGYEQLMAQIELKREAAKSPEVEALEQALAADESDHATRVKLAVQLSQVAQYRDAFEHLLVVMKADRDFGDGEAKRLYLDTLATVGKGDPLAAEYQRKLFSLLY
ncbi:thioredoxin [Luminiphilus syltensis NOR5-1B]|uniref:Thioredoxin n=1 Tax=Luminiphilus syltensis NOR5-1B TaxID=565045 RepID=B8KWU9_9GAMM|nr:thioredoxin [Luminiphilus syltensis]EED35572.1 thioredoxin [Luminiphilus syltensis NOR5-1B]